MKKQPEYTLHSHICEYVKRQYPNVDFISDTIAAVRLTIPQQVRNKKIQKEGFKCPDIILLQPNNKYHGLFIEVKVETPFKKDGSIKASGKEHLLNQQRTMEKLNARGYYASFAWSFEMAKEIIDNYLNNKL